MRSETVIGIDGWKGGWVAVVLDGGRFEAAFCVPDIASLDAHYGDVAAVGIDMPIGFPTDGPRRSDVEARKFVGPRGSSVFTTLPEAAYRAGSYGAATEITQRLWGKGISQQSYALRTRVLEIDSAISAIGIHEIHPEVSFRAMAGQPLAWSKKTWNGQQQRTDLLEQEGIVLPTHLGEAGTVPVDDILDAAACAWSADRIRRGEASTLPADPLPGEPSITY
ncbi:MAG: DUF429 domain-containing protein [Acidimicrobiia bacterium]|nr:DUF429 domain-containing protein [Acidimicrobiia bacterium]